MAGLRVLAVGFALYVIPSFGITFGITGTYSGKGTWKADDGTSGSWKAELVISKDSKGYRLKQKQSRDLPDGTTQTDSQDWLASEKGDGFFDVDQGGTIIGWGHCDMGGCQIDGENGSGVPQTETLIFEKGGIDRYGHETGAGVKTLWKGRFVKK